MRVKWIGLSVALGIWLLAAGRVGAFAGPLRVSEQNPRYFTDNSGKAIFLTGAHTWRNFQAIGSDNFNFANYLNFLADNKHNFMRLWIWETYQGAAGFGNKVISPLPFVKTGTKYDLAQLNQAFFDRMRQYVVQAGSKGIYVSIQLFNGWSLGSKNSGDPNPWQYHPFNSANNVNGVNGGSSNGYAIETLSNATITALQDAYVRKVVDTVNDLDNVIYEITNEGESNSVAWQGHMIDLIHDYERTKAKQHPVGMTVPYPNGSNNVLFSSRAEWVAPNDGGGYKDNPPVNSGSKVIISDTDHLWGLGGNRGWAWKSFTRGLMVSYMDCYVEDSEGCPISQSNSERRSLIANMGYIRGYADKMNLIRMTPQNSLASTGYVLAESGKEYLVYQPGSGSFSVNLASGNYNYEWFNPSTGQVAGTGSVSGGGSKSFTPPFSGDAVMYLKSGAAATPTPVPTPSPTATSFPTTGILDNFNRSNQGPPLSSNWGIVQHGHKVSNQRAVGIDSADDNLSVWKSPFNTPVEAYLTIASDPNSSVYAFYLLRGWEGQMTDEDGYECWFDTRAGFDKLHIVRVDNRVEAQLGSLLGISQITNGDSVGCSVGGGVIRAWWRPAGGVWTLLGERTDNTYQGPYYIIPETWALGSFDDLGGGTAGPSPSQPPSIPGDTNGNGHVDIFDYNNLISDFGTGSTRSDFDHNGKVDIFDYNTLVANFGR